MLLWRRKPGPVGAGVALVCAAVVTWSFWLHAGQSRPASVGSSAASVQAHEDVVETPSQSASSTTASVATLPVTCYADERCGGVAARPRIIVTTDGEIDDKCSMVRLLLYANEFDIEGLIYSSSIFHSVANGKWAGTSWIKEYVGKYGQVHGNLLKHDSSYPSAAKLRSRIFVGNIRDAGDMSSDTEGSKRIAQVLLERDTRPVLLFAWGGNNTIARALKKIQQDHSKDMDRVCKKARLVFTLNQDNTLHDYIRPQWPNLTIIGAYGCWKGIGYATSTFVPTEQRAFYSKNWMLKNITQNHGALCSHRPNASGGLFVGEGDSVTVLYAASNGLRGMENPGYGSWGGRYEQEKECGHWWSDALDDFDVAKTVWRWIPHFQNDLAARADWCVKEYDKANHPPAVSLGHGPDLSTAPGRQVNLTASASDPDGDKLSYRWWYYNGPSTYTGTPTVRNPNGPKAVLSVPADACEDDTMHVVCQVTDRGFPPLTRYRQIKVTVRSDATSRPARTVMPFVLGVNFGGPDTVIDGNVWRGMTSAQANGLAVFGTSVLIRKETPVPAADANTVAMLRNTITAGGDFSIAQTIANGDYHVYLWVFEWGDFYWSFSRVFDIEMEGVKMGRNLGALRTKAWRKYGPFPVSVADGRLNISVKKKNREPHLSGMSVHKANGGTPTRRN